MSRIYLKKAGSKDIDLLFRRMNYRRNVKNLFKAISIEYYDHKYLLEDCIQDKNIDIYICYLDSEAIGEVILYYKDKSVIINYNIDEKYKGQIFEEAIIKLVEIEVMFIKRCINFFIKNVKLDDIGLQRILEDNGYHVKLKDKEYVNYCKKIDFTKKNVNRYIDIGKRETGGILFLTNNRNTLKLYDWLLYHEKLVYLYSGRLNINQLECMKPNFIISYNYKYIIGQDIISYMKGHIINLHISYLPWNKGAYPNFWSFIDNTPKGVTIHKIDTGIDTGDIFCQKLIEFNEEQETFRTSYEKLNNEVIELFKENWNLIKTNAIKCTKQKGRGTYHTKLDFEKFTKIYPVSWDENIAEYKRRIAQNYDWNKS